MLLSEEELKKLSHLEIYAELVNRVYIFITPYYFEKINGDTYKESIKNLFFDIKDQIFEIDHIIPSLNVQFGYLVSVIKEYSDDLLKSIEQNKTPEGLLLETLKNFKQFLNNFLTNDSTSSLNLYSEQLAEQKNSYILRESISSAIKVLNKDSDLSHGGIVKKLLKLEDSLSLLKSQTNYSGNKIEEEIDNFLERSKEKFSDEAVSLLADLKKDIRDVDDKIKNDISTNIVNLKSYLNTQDSELQSLGLDINNYKSLIAENTENEFSKYYLEKAKEEKKVYYTVTIFSLFLIGFSIVLAWFSLTKYYNNYVDPNGLKNTIKGLTPSEVEWIQQTAFLYLSLRLVISVLLFLTIIYTGRIAYRAYLHWRHSENTHLKLSSLRPFISDLPPEDRREIRKNLIPDFFGKDTGNFDSVSENFKDLPTNVSSLAAKAIEQVGNNLSGKGSTEKNTKKSEDETK